MMIPTEQFATTMHTHQRALFERFGALVAAGVREAQMFMEEWHRRCRKTTAALNLEIREAARIPKTKYGHICPTQVMARNIIWDDPNMLRAYLPDREEFGWKLNEQKMLITFENGSVLKIGGADEPDAWRGTDFIGVTLDEWSLMKENLWTEILRPVIAGPLPPSLDGQRIFRWANFLYTPKGVNHATLMFDEACCLADGGLLPDCGVAVKLRPDWFASRVDGEKSGIFSTAELARMRAEMPKALYDQEIKCSRVTTEEMTLITSEMIAALNEYHTLTPAVPDTEARRIVSIDPAFGGDVCRMMGFDGPTVVRDRRIRDRHRTNEICTAAKVLAQQVGTRNFIVDCIGNGLGVADGLATDEASYHVQYFNSAEKPLKDHATTDELQFVNRRADAYFHAAEMIRRFEAGPIAGTELIRQLPFASRYATQSGSGKVIILPKEQIRKNLGCSPDDADCYVMGLWGLQFAQPEKIPARREDRVARSAMA